MEYPEQGEIVIGKITKVLNYGVFMELIEYDNMQGFVHISEVSTSWVKNIRNFVKEGQIRAGKVTNVYPEKKQIDISLTKVSSKLQRSKIEEYKQFKRIQKLLELLAEDMKEKHEVAWAEVAEPLLKHYDSLYEAFNAIRLNGESEAKGVSNKWLKPLVEMVEKNFELPIKTVKAKVLISVPDSGGIEVIKKTLNDVQKKAGSALEIFYEGSGIYSMKVSAPDYKSAEKNLKEIYEGLNSIIVSSNGKTEFERVEK